jgi:hypothetical protein
VVAPLSFTGGKEKPASVTGELSHLCAQVRVADLGTARTTALKATALKLAMMSSISGGLYVGAIRNGSFSQKKFPNAL